MDTRALWWRLTAPNGWRTSCTASTPSPIRFRPPMPRAAIHRWMSTPTTCRWIHGPHTFKFGGNVRHLDQYGFNDNNIFQTATFTTSNGNAPPSSVTPADISAADLTRFQNLYNDLLGRVNQVTQTFYTDLQSFQAPGTHVIRNYLFNDVGAFFQDDWKIRRNLTVNVGVRWEYFGIPHEQNGLQGTVSNVPALVSLTPTNTLSVSEEQFLFQVGLEQLRSPLWFLLGS